VGPTSIPHLVPPRALHLSCWSSFKKKRSRSCHIIQIGKLWIFSFWLSKRTGISTRSDSESEGVTQVRLWETDCTTPSEQEWDLATCSISRNFKDVCNICKGAKTAIAQSASLLDLLWNLHPFKSTFQEKDATKSQNPKQGVGDLLYDDRMVLDQSVFVDPHKITSVFGGSSRGVAVSVEPLELAWTQSMFLNLSWQKQSVVAVHHGSCKRQQHQNRIARNCFDQKMYYKATKQATWNAKKTLMLRCGNHALWTVFTKTSDCSKVQLHTLSAAGNAELSASWALGPFPQA